MVLQTTTLSEPSSQEHILNLYGRVWQTWLYPRAAHNHKSENRGMTPLAAETSLQIKLKNYNSKVAIIGLTIIKCNCCLCNISEVHARLDDEACVFVIGILPQIHRIFAFISRWNGKPFYLYWIIQNTHIRWCTPIDIWWFCAHGLLEKPHRYYFNATFHIFL